MFLSLSVPSFLSKINENISLGEDFLKKLHGELNRIISNVFIMCGFNLNWERYFEWAISIKILISAVILQVGSLDQQHQHHLGTCKKCTFSGLTPDLLHQWLGAGPGTCVPSSSPEHSGAHLSLRTSDLGTPNSLQSQAVRLG